MTTTTNDREQEQALLRMDNEDRLRAQIDSTFLICIDRLVERFAKEAGSDKAALYRSFLRGGKHRKMADYIYAIVNDTMFAVVKAAAKDLPAVKDAVRLPSYDRWDF